MASANEPTVDLDDVINDHRPAFVRLMSNLSLAYAAQGYVVAGPFDDIVANTWSIIARPVGARDEERTIDCHLRITLATGGGAQPADGIAFDLRAVSWAGTLLEAIEPSPGTWVSIADEEAISARLEVFESVDLAAFVAASIEAAEAGQRADPTRRGTSS
jgi:hypothetical protein